ncbi:MAG: biotin--[acetyl-CoA-carboxylase] ligase [Anaerovoracaceae bacterium]|nr:biotin--[acetyl-CoA-carboxylase] ligase [Bacillota bacterium]MDY2671514.1 biotin--[acetyl-CoA-carboxylase] ligase [Anaerovoracaceae bacterium]
MNVKEKVLRFLEDHREEFVSGEQIAESLGVTRSSVWKAISSFRNEGYKIEAVTRKGYRLRSDGNMLTQAGIASRFKYADPDLLTVYQETDSTNTRIKAAALEGAPHGTAAVANEQTAGRGRLGRSFISPPGSGIYLSILLRPHTDMAGAIPLTTAAAVAVCESVRELTGMDAGIKWVNDVYIGHKKICGILTEAVADVETGGLDSVVVGIGINYSYDPDSFPEDLQDRIGWIYEDQKPEISRNELAAAVIDRTIYYADHLDERAFIEPYRKYSVIIGRDIVCSRGNERFEARAVDIDDDGGLVVETDSGRRTLSSGEITVRWKKD